MTNTETKEQREAREKNENTPEFKTERDNITNQLESMRIEHSIELAKVKDSTDKEEAALETKLTSERPVQPLTLGKIEYQGHSSVDGRIMKGVVDLPFPGFTDEGVYNAVGARVGGELSSEGFSFNKVVPTVTARELVGKPAGSVGTRADGTPLAKPPAVNPPTPVKK